MTDHNKAQISALMDGELDAMETGKLLQDRTLKSTWHRYHIISDVLQNRTPTPNLELSLSISELIRNEPAILAPTRKAMPAYLRPVAGIAVAASVATLAILGVQQYRASQLQSSAPALASVADSNTMIPVPASAPVPLVVERAGVQPVLVSTRTTVPMVQPVDNQTATYQAGPDSQQISRYILNHNEYQSMAGVHGVTPHVRLVATDGRR